jgi:hypothetical protein
LRVFSAHSLFSVSVSFSKAVTIDSTEALPAKHLLESGQRRRVRREEERGMYELYGVSGREEKARLGLWRRRSHLAQDVVDGRD